jgi:hypothetical protein
MLNNLTNVEIDAVLQILTCHVNVCRQCLIIVITEAHTRTDRYTCHSNIKS